VSRIRRPQTLIFAAWIVQLAAWLLPALNVLDSPVRGWQTFFVTLSVFWPSKDVVYGAWYDPLLLGLSAITTLLFVVGSPLVVFRGSRSIRYTSAWVASAAFVANAHWYIFGEIQSAVSKLRIGYFVWWLSFAFLALGLFGVARQEDPDVMHPQADLLPEGTS
jgi:hypothetical protein